MLNSFWNGKGTLFVLFRFVALYLFWYIWCLPILKCNTFLLLYRLYERQPFVSLKRFRYFNIRFASFLPIIYENVCSIHEILASKIYIYILYRHSRSLETTSFIHSLKLNQITHFSEYKKYVNIHMSTIEGNPLSATHFLCQWIKQKNLRNSIEQLISQFIYINS